MFKYLHLFRYKLSWEHGARYATNCMRNNMFFIRNENIFTVFSIRLGVFTSAVSINVRKHYTNSYRRPTRFAGSTCTIFLPRSTRPGARGNSLRCSIRFICTAFFRVYAPSSRYGLLTEIVCLLGESVHHALLYHWTLHIAGTTYTRCEGIKYNVVLSRAPIWDTHRCGILFPWSGIRPLSRYTRIYNYFAFPLGSTRVHVESLHNSWLRCRSLAFKWHV